MVTVSGGYPGNYEKGKPVKGLDAMELQGKMIFHSGTKNSEAGIVTNGGRVLAVTAYGNNITDAVNQSNNLLSFINFEKMYYRPDIGYEFTGL